MNYKKIKNTLCLAAVSALFLTGCGGSKNPLDPKEPVSLTIWCVRLREQKPIRP